MTKLDAVLERIRQLPQDRQEAIVAEVEFMLENGAGESLLTGPQWAEVEAALADENEAVVPHDEVMDRARRSLIE